MKHSPTVATHTLAIILSFLEGRYHAGCLPSRAESQQLARYLRRTLVEGTQQEVERQIEQAMTLMRVESSN